MTNVKSKIDESCCFNESVKDPQLLTKKQSNLKWILGGPKMKISLNKILPGSVFCTLSDLRVKSALSALRVAGTLSPASA